MNKDLLQFLACPICHKPFLQKQNLLLCKKCQIFLEEKNGIILNISTIPEDLKLSLEKWDLQYKQSLQKRAYLKNKLAYDRIYLKDTISQLEEEKSLNRSVYLEIGCGEFFVGQAVARQCNLIIGIDISENALKLAKIMLDKQHIHNYLLIQGDIRRIPLKNSCVDLIYGGGVIEHFKDTFSCLSELYRVLKIGGVSFNTVPYLNLGSLTYRQVWGNIPNIPIIKQIAEFLHIKLLKGRHMKFGYEMSFLKSSLKNLHKKVGFRTTKVDQFKVTILFDFLPSLFRPFFIKLANSSPLFWPMVKVVAKK